MLATCTLSEEPRYEAISSSVIATADRPLVVLTAQASEEWPGNRWASGSIATAALLTAVAASPEPTAMRRTFPGDSVTSPAAKTRGRFVAVVESTMMCRFWTARPQPWIGPRAATKPRAATTSCALTGVTSLVFTCSTSTDSRRPLPTRRTTLELVITLTLLDRTLSTVAWWARNASRRCTSVTDDASGSRATAQSKALS